MKRKVLNRSVPLWSLILALVACASVGIAALVVTRQISISMEVQLKPNMEVYDTDHTTALKVINFDIIYRGDVKTFPASGNYFLNNIGEKVLWVSYTTANWPTEVTLKIYVKRGDDTGFGLLPEGTITGFSLLTPDTLVTNGDYMDWYIEIQVSSTAPETFYNPTLTWKGYDSSTG